MGETFLGSPFLTVYLTLNVLKEHVTFCNIFDHAILKLFHASAITFISHHTVDKKLKT